MNIDLTPYGRYLLSIGKLKPKFYDFVDDDILYDGSQRFSGSTIRQSEPPHKAHDRIILSTPKLKSMYLRKGVESDTQENYSSAELQNIQIDDIRTISQETTYNQNEIGCMGRSSYESNILPSFQVTMLQGQITGSVQHMSSSIVQLPIPQVDVDFTVTVTLEDYSLITVGDRIISKIIDNQVVALSYNNPIIHIKEFGSFYEKENFDIEVFELNDYTFNTTLSSSAETKILSPKHFLKPPDVIINDMLVDRDTEVSLFNTENHTRENVEYYFDIQVDKDIPVEEICEAVDGLEINNRFLDEEIICPDLRSDRFDIYSSRIDPTDLEDCD